MLTSAPHNQEQSALMTPELRRANKRPTRHPAFEPRGKAWVHHARITLAESPELYMREEMG